MIALVVNVCVYAKYGKKIGAKTIKERKTTEERPACKGSIT